MKSTSTTKQIESNRVVPVRVSNELLCFDAADVLSISQGANCRFLAEPMDQIVGEIDDQGEKVSVVSLRRLFGATNDSTENQYIIVANTRHGKFGFQVDDVLRARETEAAIPIPPIAVDPAKPFFSGVVQFEDDHDDGEETNSALLLTTDGLIGDLSPRVASFLKTPALDLTGLSADTVRKSRQLMLFDLPHRSWNNQVISIGLSVTQVLEVTQLIDLMQVPCPPQDFIGIVPWRNQFVPVMDLTRRLSLDSMPAQARRRIVIARGEDDSLLAFYASDNIRTLRLPIEAVQIAMENVTGMECVRGCYATQEGTIVIPGIKELTRPIATAARPELTAIA